MTLLIASCSPFALQLDDCVEGMVVAPWFVPFGTNVSRCLSLFVCLVAIVSNRQIDAVTVGCEKEGRHFRSEKGEKMKNYQKMVTATMSEADATKMNGSIPFSRCTLERSWVTYAHRK